MSYYNRAALIGGFGPVRRSGISDAFSTLNSIPAPSLMGGWEMSQPMFKAKNGGEFVAAAAADALAQPGIDGVKAEIMDDYNINERHLNNAITVAYLTDCAMAWGTQRIADYANAMIRMYGSFAPYFKKVVQYVRRKIHRGKSDPYRMTKAEREEVAAALAAARKERRDYLKLKTTPWYGSDPFNRGMPGKRGSYKSLYPGLTRAYRNSLPPVPARLMAYKRGDKTLPLSAEADVDMIPESQAALRFNELYSLPWKKDKAAAAADAMADVD